LELQVALQLGRPSQRRTELLVVISTHSFQEVEPGGAVRADASDGGARQDPVGQQRGAGQRMGTATRPTGRVEPPRPQLLDDRQGVSCAVGNRPTRLP
jgi:hypothetical protein